MSIQPEGPTPSSAGAENPPSGEHSNKKKDKADWFESLLAILNLRENIKSLDDARYAAAEIAKEVDPLVKKEKSKALSTILRKLLIKEDQSAVDRRESEELEILAHEAKPDLDKLGKWLERWGKKRKDEQIEDFGKQLSEKKDEKILKTLISSEAREKVVGAVTARRESLDAEVTKLSESLNKLNEVEVGLLSESIASLSKKIADRESTPEELEKIKKGLFEWGTKLEESTSWKRYAEDVNITVPEWVKSVLGEKRIEKYMRSAIAHELLNGVTVLDTIQKQLQSGMALEDVVRGMGKRDVQAFEKIYRSDLYRTLREETSLGDLLERIEVIRNPWREKSTQRSVGEASRGVTLEGLGVGGRGDEAKDTRNLGRVSRLQSLEDMIGAMIGESPAGTSGDDASEADNALRRTLRSEANRFPIFNNIDYRQLPLDIQEMIDFSEWENSHGASPAYVRNEILNDPAKKKQFLNLWRDRTRLALRKIAYQQSESRYQDPVMAEFTTLLSILGIPSSEKGMIKVEAQLYGLVDAMMRGAGNKEVFAKLFGILESGGVGFRIFDKLKENREKVYWVKNGIIAPDGDRKVFPQVVTDAGKELRVGAFDFMRMMGHRLTAEELVEAGLPADTKMMWGTVIYRKTVDTDIEALKKLFMKKVLKQRGVKDPASKEWFDDVFDFYQDFIDEAVYMKAVHAEIDGIVGNASLTPGEYEFPAGLKEYLMGKLSISGARYFEAKYGNGNIHEAVSILDGGVRSIALMARTELLNHFVGKSTTTEGNLGAQEVFFSKVANAGLREALTVKWNKIWEKSLYHHGRHDHHDQTSMFTSFGDEGSVDSGLLRPTWNTIKVLRELRSRGEFTVSYGGNQFDIAEMIDYSEFVKILKDEEFGDYLLSDADSHEKLDRLIDRYGEDYRSYSGEKSKRWSDWPVKYWISKLDEAFGLIQELSNDPYNVTVQKKLLDLYQSTNAGGVAAYQRMIQEMIEWYAADVGSFGKFKRYKRKINGDRVTLVFDREKGIFGDDQEFPGIASEEDGGFAHDFREEVKNESGAGGKVKAGAKSVGKYVVDLLVGNPARNRNSLAAAYGHGGVGEWSIRNMLLQRRALGYYRNEDQFGEEWRKWALGVLWNRNKTYPENIWNWVTLNAPFEYIGMVYLGVEGHKLREILSENSEKTFEKMMHYLTGSGH